ncbi:hypothetical protein [Enterococcus caccae]|uniref:Uncharacterized protein n=1 Tax=Enterococcus caccae ATCC BAA-1240 TaxID=1158612 RepID=R3WXC6_9ENTE|nr:hypothetical protein [Enterococcus caccae]EOL46425.1 hypothetical protein UC7_01392 [Enterococcus caccae ATCC BAA-1240]EOT60794.1 hypothetical protein I580_01694 [Enterococcus caccae ATCC BAA-1240]OJG27395.1 hypothetical protein RU98_GL002484 [Enterococcus caccae]
MEKVKTIVISLLGLVGAIRLFGGGVLFAFLFILLFILSVLLEAITSRSKKTSSI